jgi:hypothetical protein
MINPRVDTTCNGHAVCVIKLGQEVHTFCIALLRGSAQPVFALRVVIGPRRIEMAEQHDPHGCLSFGIPVLRSFHEFAPGNGVVVVIECRDGSIGIGVIGNKNGQQPTG